MPNSHSDHHFSCGIKHLWLGFSFVLGITISNKNSNLKNIKYKYNVIQTKREEKGREKLTPRVQMR